MAKKSTSYAVQLPGLPVLEINAAGPEQAFEAYKRHFNVTHTIRKPTITKIVESEPLTANAD